MTLTHGIGYVCGKIIRLIVRGLALSRIHPNVLTFLGLVINIVAAYMLAVGQFRWGGAVIIGNTPAEFAAIVKADVAKWTKVIQSAGIRPE